jgi:hypothetical protein
MAGPLLGLAKAYLGNQARNYATSQIENAAGLPKDSIALATNPVGFAGKVIKDVAKDYGKQGFFGRNDIPVEDRSPTPAGSLGGSETPIEDLEWEGDYQQSGMKRGGNVKSKVKSKVSKASSRGDGIAQRGKTKGRYI